MDRRKHSLTLFLIVGIAASLLLVGPPLALPSVAAASTPTLTVTPTTLALGGSISISGTAFAADEPVVLAIDGLGAPLATLKAQPDGAVPLTTLTIPATVQVGPEVRVLAPGVHTLTLTGGASARSASVQLTLLPAVTLAAASLPLGGQATLSGAGFAAQEYVSVLLSPLSGVLGTVRADAYGLIPLTQLAVPSTWRMGAETRAISPGAYTLTLVGTSSGRAASTAVTLVSAVTVSAATLPLGGRVDVAGAGFSANEAVAVSISQMEGSLATLSADAQGLVPLTGLTVPATVTVGAEIKGLSPGEHTLTLKGAASGRTASVLITLVPALGVSAATIAVGSPLGVSGAGFSANERVRLTLSQTSGVLATLGADNNGLVLTSTVTIPANAALGARSLALTGETSGRSASVTLTLVQPTIPPGLSVRPSTTDSGGLITVSGDGFAAHDTVTLWLQGVSAPLAALTANAQGQLAATGLSIPYYLGPGVYALQARATPSGRSAAASLTLVALAPAISVSAVPLRPGAQVTVSGRGFGRSEQITLALNGEALATTPTVLTTDGAFSALVTLPPSLLRGPNTLSATGSQSRVSATTTLNGELPVVTTLYFAGAATGRPRPRLAPGAGYWDVQVAMYLRSTPSLHPTSRLLVPAGASVKEWGAQPTSEWVHITWQGHDGYLLARNMAPAAAGVSTVRQEASLAILNTATQPAHIALTFYYEGGAPGTASLEVAAHSRGTADLNALAGENRVFGLKLSADRAVTAQLQVRRSETDGFSLLGVSAPATTWYLAEGYTGGDFRETLALVNPGEQVATVQVRVLPGAGRAERRATVTVAPRCTLLVDVNRLWPNQSVAVIVSASQPIVVARTITFGPGGYGSTAKTGSTAPATNWMFVQGLASAPVRISLSVLNPNPEGSYVTARLYSVSGSVLGSRSVYVPGYRRATITLDAAAGQIATMVTGDRPIVVEQPLYVGTARVAASDVFGRNGSALTWSFPAGDTQSQQEVLSVFNPMAQTAELDLTFYGSDGRTSTRRISVSPMSVTVVDVGALGADVAGLHGVVVRAVNGVGVVAEQTVFAPTYATLDSSEGCAS